MKKYFLTPAKNHLSAIRVSQNQLDEWINDWMFFFILGFGRSGTAFLANLLNQAQGALVRHEPVIGDFYAHLKAHYNPRDAEKYMSGFRKKEIYLCTRRLTPGVYGEVNGILRCHAEAIKNAFPDVTLIHLVRDGRNVIRSHMSRRTMTIKNPFSMMMHPAKLDPWRARWHEMDRFSRICWYWQLENSRLRKAIGKTVQFEKVLSCYEYFHDEILVPCHIYIDKKDWEAGVASPRNVTGNFQMPEWDDWTSQQQETFREICGNEMLECGYVF